MNDIISSAATNQSSLYCQSRRFTCTYVLPTRRVVAVHGAVAFENTQGCTVVQTYIQTNNLSVVGVDTSILPLLRGDVVLSAVLGQWKEESMPCHMSHDIIETSLQNGDAISFEDELLEALLDTKNDSTVCRHAEKDIKTRSFQRPVGRTKTRTRKRARTVEVLGGKGHETPTVQDDHGTPSLGLTDLPSDCLEKIVSRLSPTALCCVSQMCTVLNRIASSQSLWKALYHMRWSSTGNELIEHDEMLGQNVSWKALYMRQDAEELVGKGRMVDDGQGQLYIQMARAFREHTLTDREVDLCMYGGEVCIPGSVSEHAERFKAVHGIRNGGSEEHACEFVRLVRHHWICRCCGVVHACGESCLETERCAGDDMMVCRLTGCCSREMLSTDYKGEDGHGDGNHEEAGMGGRLGRAFFAGYNAADNKEMMTRFGVSIED